MSGDNMLKFKQKIHPEWYLDGPVKVYNEEERQAWLDSMDKRIQHKLDMQAGLSVEELKLLDAIDASCAEDTWNDIMEGHKE